MNGTAQQNDTLSVLFIGNSLTFYHDLPEMIAKLVQASGERPALFVKMVTIGGASLEMHWEKGMALKEINSELWDYVVLQDQSSNPVRNPENFNNYVRKFNAEIKKRGGRTLLYLTAAYRNRPEMQELLNNAFFKIAQELNIDIAPVGIASRNALDEKSDFVFHLPDKIHPNLTGAYLTACVFYSVFYKKSPGGLPNQITVNGSVKVLASPPEAEFLQQIAWETVKNMKNGEKHENE